MKVVKTDYLNNKEILKFPDHYVATAVMVSDTGIAAVNGKKVVPAGTIVGKDSETVKPINGANSDGVLLSDVDVTYGAAPASMVIHGFIDKSKIPTEPTPEALAALKMIKFI